MVTAGCTGGSDAIDGGLAVDEQTTLPPADQSTTTDTASSGDDADDADEGDGGDTDGTAEDPATEDIGIAGRCSAINTNTELFYAVTNIAEDDPDGGLNVRDNFEDGEVVATLPEGSVVFTEDCYQVEDGTAWFAITTADDVLGWVNASFLTPNISPLEPTFGGEETAAKVEMLLDALAARRWELAASQLTLEDSEYLPLAPLLGAPGSGNGETSSEEDPDAEETDEESAPDLAALLQDYCSVRICDAPYSIVDIRGSYVPDRESPEVDVRFTYSGGIVTETFGQIAGEGDDFILDTLPGQSILAFGRTRPTVTQLATDAENAPAGVLEAAEAVRRGLLDEAGPGIPDDYLPDEGVVLSANAFIPEVISERQVVTGEDLVSNRDADRIWGHTDGVGRPIIASVDEWMASYRRNIALLEPDVIGIEERVGLGNTIDNLGASFPNATTVEFHRAGRGELSDFNWSSVRLALELRDREWKVVAIVLDSWTV